MTGEEVVEEKITLVITKEAQNNDVEVEDVSPDARTKTHLV